VDKQVNRKRGTMSILLCYDGSLSSKHALAVTRAMLSANEIVLLYVWRPPAAIAADAFGEPDAAGPTIIQLESREIERARVVTDEARELEAAHPGPAVDVRIERQHAGGVSATIVDVANQLGSELIVVGTHGQTAVEPGLLGSVSGELVHQARIPVLVVPTRTQTHTRPTGVAAGAAV
jgi:nucleotide-binding universal stress UspA family protein